MTNTNTETNNTNLAAIQELYQRLQEKDSQIKLLHEKILELEQKVNSIKSLKDN
ncbi:MAG: hypothetical protein AAFV71_14940 [Cyanobacteria bacterium J06633_8]